MFQENETKNRVCQWRLETCYYRVRRSHGLPYNANPCNIHEIYRFTPFRCHRGSTMKYVISRDAILMCFYLEGRHPCNSTTPDQHRTSIDIFTSVDHLAAQHRHNEVPLPTRRQHMTPYSQLSYYQLSINILYYMSKFTIAGMAIIASLLDEERDNRKRREIWN